MNELITATNKYNTLLPQRSPRKANTILFRHREHRDHREKRNIFYSLQRSQSSQRKTKTKPIRCLPQRTRITPRTPKQFSFATDILIPCCSSASPAVQSFHVFLCVLGDLCGILVSFPSFLCVLDGSIVFTFFSVSSVTSVARSSKSLFSDSRFYSASSAVKYLSRFSDHDTGCVAFFSDTPADENVAISARVRRPASTSEIPSAAPVPSPSRRFRSRSGRCSRCSSIFR